ncbi:unnamed protein product [Rotaria sp. Silwood2]|nr:unnamed protein product [Rotaria sp. Silwood2]
MRSDEKKICQIIDKHGWLQTSDVSECLVPERLEHMYIRLQWIVQIFVDNVSTESSIVAIVMPHKEYVRQNFKTTITLFDDVCKDTKSKQFILNDLQRLAKEYKFKYHKCIKNIRLHLDLFSKENSFITSRLKTRRRKA